MGQKRRCQVSTGNVKEAHLSKLKLCGWMESLRKRTRLNLDVPQPAEVREQRRNQPRRLVCPSR
jgi:hypothetical protein